MLWLRQALAACLLFLPTALADAQGVSAPAAGQLLEGKAAYGDWRSDAPGIRRHIRVSDLPLPYSTPSIANSVSVVARPAHAQLRVPPGFGVRLFATGLDQPRLIRVAPNGDVFVVESSAGRIRLLRPTVNGNEVGQNMTQWVTVVGSDRRNLPIFSFARREGDGPRTRCRPEGTEGRSRLDR
jgi:hypothetical protein